MNEGKMSLQDLAKNTGKSIKKINGVMVSGPIEPPLDEAIRPFLFKNDKGSYLEFQPAEAVAAIIYIKDYKLNPMKEEQKQGFPVLQNKMEEEMKQEAALMYIDALGKKYEARINEDLMKRAYGQNAATGAP
jgi:hypothetical protein